jgi:hypothetical protein
MANFWATLKCTTNPSGAGGVASTFGKSVQPGKSVTFTPQFSVSTGAALSCQICFENWGVPKPGGGIDYSQKFSKCNDVGSYTAKRSCVCTDFKNDQGVPYQTQCGANQAASNVVNKGNAGQCRECQDCQYPDENLDSSWTPAKSTRCDGVVFTQSLKSTNFPTQCAAKTRQATGTKQPDWSDWAPDPADVCSYEPPFQRTKYDKNACVADQTQSSFSFGTKDCPCTCDDGWSDTMPSYSVVTGEPCPAGKYLRTKAGAGGNPCQTCYKCDDCGSSPALPIKVYRTGGISILLATGGQPQSTLCMAGCGHTLIGTIQNEGDSVAVSYGCGGTYNSVEAAAVDACGRCVYYSNSTSGPITVSYSSCSIGGGDSTAAKAAGYCGGC